MFFNLIKAFITLIIFSAFGFFGPSGLCSDQSLREHERAFHSIRTPNAFLNYIRDLMRVERYSQVIDLVIQGATQNYVLHQSRSLLEGIGISVFELKGEYGASYSELHATSLPLVEEIKHRIQIGDPSLLAWLSIPALDLNKNATKILREFPPRRTLRLATRKWDIQIVPGGSVYAWNLPSYECLFFDIVINASAIHSSKEVPLFPLNLSESIQTRIETQSSLRSLFPREPVPLPSVQRQGIFSRIGRLFSQRQEPPQIFLSNQRAQLGDRSFGIGLTGLSLGDRREFLNEVHPHLVRLLYFEEAFNRVEDIIRRNHAALSTRIEDVRPLQTYDHLSHDIDSVMPIASAQSRDLERITVPEILTALSSGAIRTSIVRGQTFTGQTTAGFILERIAKKDCSFFLHAAL